MILIIFWRRLQCPSRLPSHAVRYYQQSMRQQISKMQFQWDVGALLLGPGRGVKIFYWSRPARTAGPRKIFLGDPQCWSRTYILVEPEQGFNQLRLLRNFITAHYTRPYNTGCSISLRHIITHFAGYPIIICNIKIFPIEFQIFRDNATR